MSMFCGLPIFLSLVVLVSPSVQQDLCSTSCLRVGAKGEKGETGGANNEQLNAMMETIKELRQRLEALEQREQVVSTTATTTTKSNSPTTTEEGSTTTKSNSSTTTTKSNIPTTTEEDSCPGGVIYDNQCIWLAYTTYRDAKLPFSRAVEICRHNNSHVAEITSDEMHDVLERYVRRTWNFGSRRKVTMWLGSTYTASHHRSMVITLTNGRRITLTRWYRGYPAIYPSYRQMSFAVQKYDWSTRQGVFNYHPILFANAPLCAHNL